MTDIQVKRGDIDFRGYDIARSQFFTSVNIISVTFSRRYIRFSSDCVRKFGNTEYIGLLVHPDEPICIVRQRSANQKDVMRWSKIHAGKIYCRTISGAAFLDTLYDLFNWNPGCNYRLRGEIIRFDNERAVSFNICEPEIFVPHDMELPQDFYITKQTSRAFITLPQSWKDNFGESYYSYLSRRSIKLSGMSISDVTAEYNTQPELHPTPPEKVGENMQDLFIKMQNKGEFHGNTTIAESQQV